MLRILQVLISIAFVLCFLSISYGQIDDICREAGVVPSLDSPFAPVPYIYGRVSVKGADPAKPLKVTVIFSDREQNEIRWTVGKSGNYCFKRNNSSGGNLVIEVNGAEATRKTLPSFGPNQQREDFEISPPELSKVAAPGTVSAKFTRPSNEKTMPLYERAADAENEKRPADLVTALKEIVQVDPEDFVAWAKLGTVYFEQENLTDADAALRRSLELRVDYTPAWMNVGKLRMAQKQYEAAAEIFKHASTLEPASARVYRSLGEAYIYAKKGSLGTEALNKAIEMDPVGMAEAHLMLAALYDRAGAKDRASREYKMFLEKVKNHPDKKKFEKYISENPVK